MADSLDQLGVEGFANLGYHGGACLSIGGIEPDFDQLVMIQGTFDLVQHGRVDTAATDDDDGLEIMGERLQLIFLDLCQHDI